MPKLLVIEDGTEYFEFAQAFLRPSFTILQAQSGRDALALLATEEITALLIDLRFDRARPEQLLGDVQQTAAQLFCQDTFRATRYLQDQQGVFILAAARSCGHAQRAVFVHDFPARRLENLRKLYGSVEAVPTFDAPAILRCLQSQGTK